MGFGLDAAVICGDKFVEESDIESSCCCGADLFLRVSGYLSDLNLNSRAASASEVLG